MDNIELLAPAGSADALKAAVQSGCDAVYFGTGSFNARRNAKNIADEALNDAIEYCRARGVKTYATVNIQITDHELEDALKLVKKLYLAGCDGFITADLGLARLLKQAAPDIRLHASTQMSVHNLEGVKWLAEQGFKRVVLARELSREDMRIIAQKSPVETEVFVHGALCMCYSGQCYMSAFLGGRSGSRGLCAQPCRLIYELGKDKGNLLSLKDMCLGEYIEELKSIGISSLKIEGRMKRAEYTAAVTGAYASAIKGEGFTQETYEKLARVFSRGGFTSGYYTGKTGRDMFGFREEQDKENSKEFENYLSSVLREGHEYNRIPVSFSFKADLGKPSKLTVSDKDGYVSSAEGQIPETARNRALDEETVKSALNKTGDTPYYAKKFDIKLTDGIALPLKELNSMRRQVLTDIQTQRAKLPEREFNMPLIKAESLISKNERLKIQGRFYNIEGVPENAGDIFDITWLPLEKAEKHFDDINEKLSKGCNIGLYMPRMVHDTEMPKLMNMLEFANKLGIKDILSGNIGLCRIAQKDGFTVHGDFGLNIFNSHSLLVLKDMGLKSSVLSFELSFSQIEGMTKTMPCGIIAYGRAPLMVYKNCIMKDRVKCGECEKGVKLHDRKDEDFILLNEFGCRNILLNAKTTYLAERNDYKKSGLDFIRLDFYTESKDECRNIIEQYICGGSKMDNITRGLYYKGVL